MKNVGIVQGSIEQAVPLIIGKDTVYVHSDITPIAPNTDGYPIGLYSYNEIQYTKDEYIQLMAEQNKKLLEDTANLTDCVLEMSMTVYA